MGLSSQQVSVERIAENELGLQLRVLISKPVMSLIFQRWEFVDEQRAFI